MTSQEGTIKMKIGDDNIEVPYTITSTGDKPIQFNEDSLKSIFKCVRVEGMPFYPCCICGDMFLASQMVRFDRRTGVGLCKTKNCHDTIASITK